jgi:hypothetical protein
VISPVAVRRRGAWFARRVAGIVAAAAVAAVVQLPLPAAAYDPEIHQQLTFVAVKQFDRCIEETGLDRLTPLEIRYIVRTNVSSVDSGFFSGLMSWRFYDRSESDDHSLLWVVRTRMNEDFRAAAQALEEADGFAERYANLGRLIGHIQDMTSPSYAVPVYYPRWWRLSFSDRFNSFPVDVDALESVLEESCETFMNGPPIDPHQILRQTADRTVAALREPIESTSATWEVFWEVGEPGEFGSFGPAGNNFGRRAEFDCNGESCRIRSRDARYAAFALARHYDAVVATMRAMYWMQWRKRERAQDSPDPTLVAPSSR